MLTAVIFQFTVDWEVAGHRFALSVVCTFYFFAVCLCGRGIWWDFKEICREFTGLWRINLVLWRWWWCLLVRSFVPSESWDLYSTGTVQFSCCPTSNLDFIWRKLFSLSNQWNMWNIVPKLRGWDITMATLCIWLTNLIFMIHFWGVKVAH